MTNTSMRKAVLTTVRDMRAPREDALGEYVDALIQLGAAEDALARARRRRDEARSHARAMGNTGAELDEAARIVRHAADDANTDAKSIDESADDAGNDGGGERPSDDGGQQGGDAWQG